MSSEQRQVSVYRTVDPTWVVNNANELSQALFNTRPASGQTKFHINSLTGHFSYEADVRFLNYQQTPQTEDEAVVLMAGIIAMFAARTKAKAAQKQKGENWNALFNLKFLRLRSVLPNYTNGQIKFWTGIYGFDLPSGLTTSTNNPIPASPLESDAVVIDASGTSLIRVLYNHSPILVANKSNYIGEDDYGLVYRKTTSGYISPFALAKGGYVPVCKESIVLQTAHPIVSPTIGATRNSSQACGSMITLSGVVKPQNGLPGKAKIVIQMEYRYITFGEGAVANTSIAPPTDFALTYEKGNHPGKIFPGPLLLEQLPAKGAAPVVISPQNLRASKKKDPITQLPQFSNYYETTIEYKYSIVNIPNFSLWEAMKWLLQCPETRGFFYLVPFQRELQTYLDRQADFQANRDSTIPSQFSVSYIKKYLLSQGIPKSDIQQFTPADYKDISESLRIEPINAYEGKIAAYIISNILLENSSLFSNATIDIVEEPAARFKAESTRSYTYFNQDVQNALFALKSDISSTVVNNKPLVKLSGSAVYYNFLRDHVVRHALVKMSRFEENVQNITGKPMPAVGASGQINAPNIVVLNHRLFGVSAANQPFPYPSNPTTATFLTPAEMLAHEAGHNAAQLFEHGQANYQYTQTGLQSAQTGHLYPSAENTIAILCEARNLTSMLILP